MVVAALPVLGLVEGRQLAKTFCSRFGLTAAIYYLVFVAMDWRGTGKKKRRKKNE